MLHIQKTGRLKRISFRKESGEIIKNVSDLLAARKHVIHKKKWKKLQETSNVFCFVSSPSIYGQEKMRSLSKGWCHALRNKKLLPKNVPEIMLPESDFLDDKIVYYKRGKVKYDYFYFTINAEPGIKNKGLYQFLDMLPTLYQHKLRGKIVVYYPNAGKSKRFVVKLKHRHRESLRRCSRYLSFHWGLLGQKHMNNIMTSCRFGLFPNTVDNSPRIISEALIRDIPILVNENIHGGWHYVNKETGSLFSKSTLNKDIEFMMSNRFHAKEYYDANYGFEKSSKRLASFLCDLFGYEDVTHAYFSDFCKYLEDIND